MTEHIKIERRPGLAHRHAVTLAEHEQQAALRRGDPACPDLCRHEALQPPLRDIEQVDQAPIGRRLRIISHAK